MGQTFIILLRAGPQNNAKVKPVHSAKKFSDFWYNWWGPEGLIAPRPVTSLGHQGERIIFWEPHVAYIRF